MASEHVSKQQICEERAFRIVQKLIDQRITEAYLCEIGQYVSPQHYADIIEERAIDKQCGYPVCPNKLTSMISTQRYHISTKTNQVYDITERKNFCSGQCYKASKFFAKQIPSTALWLRHKQPPVQYITLSSHENRGSAGDVVLANNAGVDLQEEANDIIGVNSKNELLSRPDPKQHILQHEKLTSLSLNSEKVISSNEAKHLSVRFADVALHDEDVASHIGSSNDSTVKIVSDQETNATSVTTYDNRSRLVDESKKVEGHKRIPDDRLSEADTKEIVSTKPLSKTDYLMQLLDRRRNKLAELAEIEDVSIKKEIQLSNNLKSVISTSHTMSNVVDTSKQQSNNDVHSLTEDSSRLSEEKLAETVETLASEQDYDVKPAYKTLDVEKKIIENDNACRLSEHGKDNKEDTSPLLRVYKIVSQWKTKQTLIYLSNNKYDDGAFPTDNQSDTVKEETQEQEGEMLLHDGVSRGGLNADTPRKAVPYLRMLHHQQQEEEEFNVKIKQFYKGSFTYKSADPAGPDTTDWDQIRDATAAEEPVLLPPVDSYAQMSIRRKIVLNRVDKVLADILLVLGLSVQDVATDLRELVNTCKLSSKNITFKPGEWTVVGIILLKLLSIDRSPALQKGFASQKSQSHFQDVFCNMGSSLQQLEELVQNF